MASLFTPALCFFKHTQCTHRETHKAALETHAYTNSFSFRHGPVFSERSAPLPLHRLTRLFIFPMPTLNSNIPLHPTPQPRRSMRLARRTKKGRKISTSHHLHQNKNKQSQEKGAAKEVQGFPSPPPPFFFAPGILLMWLQAACQPNLIWIYIQRKCLV